MTKFKPVAGRPEAQGPELAKPQLYFLVEHLSVGGQFGLRYTPGTETFFKGARAVEKEGDDPDGPLQRPVHWSIERRAERLIYCSTFQATRSELLRMTRGRDFVPRSAAQEFTVTLETDLDKASAVSRGVGRVG